MGYFPRDLSGEPKHAPVWFPRQDPHHLELDPRRECLRLPQALSPRPLSHRLRLRTCFPAAGGLEMGGTFGFCAETESRSSRLMVHMPSPLPGTRLSACGSCPLAPLLADSWVTPTMSSPSPSPPTTGKSSRDPAIGPSSSGTPSATASSPSPIRATPTGFPAFDSARTPRTLSLSALAGTSLSR